MDIQEIAKRTKPERAIEHDTALEAFLDDYRTGVIRLADMDPQIMARLLGVVNNAWALGERR